MLESILDLSSTVSITWQSLLLCTGVSLLLGLVIALVFTYKNTYTRSFVITIALIPAIVQAIIMLVNGNLGAGVAVMGAFSLVRFRSAPGNAREIVSIFFAMAVGLATGMGYLWFAAVFTAIISVVMLLMTRFRFGERPTTAKSLRIVVPESLDFTGAFDDLFAAYATKYELVKVKTTNMGSLFELSYTINLKADANEKDFIDQLRCRNGNLAISLGRLIPGAEEAL